MTQTAKLTASDGAAYDDLGFSSLAVSDSTVVAGVPKATIGGHAGQGVAYVFSEPAGGWKDTTQTAKLTASDGAAEDQLGVSVGLSESTIVAGAQLATVAGHRQQGAVYVFEEPATGWATATQTTKLTASDGGTGDNLGDAIGMSMSLLVASAPGADGRAGALYVFRKPAAGWPAASQIAKLTASDGASGLGFPSIALSDHTVIAGAHYMTVDGTTTPQSAAYVFSEPAGGWTDATETQKLAIEAWSVGMSGPVLVTGAPYGGAGNARLFTTVVAPRPPLARAPRLTDVSQTRRRWREGNRRARIMRNRNPSVGTTFRFRLNVPATVRLVFTRGRTGCGRQLEHTGLGRCIAAVPDGVLRFPARGGARAVRFQGRLAGRRILRPSLYTVTITATNTAGRSVPHALRFRIMRSP
jgi:hypothetical protein